jgi:beta-lactamase superfamily II metal-dependent hydrolase
MAEVFHIELLPARHGDCLLLSYGDAARPHRVLIDGGPIGAYGALSARLAALPEDQRELELLVITHVDGDHIEGCLKLLNHPELATFRDIWFNGWPHIAQELKEPPPAPRQAPSDEAGIHQRSAMQGTEISVRIDGRQWNAAFEGAPVFVPATGPLPVRELPGGLRLTLLSPTLDKLVKLRTAWSRALERAEVDPANEAALRARLDGRAAYRASGARLRPTPDQMMSSAALALGPMDDAVANGSSIAVIAEYAGRRLALLGDAHAPTLAATLGRMAAATGAATLRLDAVKLAHHGSAANLSPDLLGRIECGTWLVSTDGSLFQHPDDEAIHAVVRQVPGARLLFNYRSARTAPWDEPAMRAAHGHQAFYPRDPAAGIALDLMTGDPS